MNCPICDVTLLIADRQGIEIDYCPKCRGIWLDRGELDQIIERSTKISDTAPYRQNFSEHHDDDHAREGFLGFGKHHDDDHEDDHDSNRRFGFGKHHDDDDYHQKGKKRGFLSDLFDF